MPNSDQFTPAMRRRALLRAALWLALAVGAWLGGLHLFGQRVSTPQPVPAPAATPQSTNTTPQAANTRPAAASPGMAVAAFRDCAACPQMVAVPRGSFTMGAGEMGEGAGAHRVTIARPFALGRYEVTQAEWRALMGSDPAHFKGDERPVEQVNWRDVQAYLKKLSRKTGKHYRLPSEAEWEYACRAGGMQTYCGGDDAGSVAWYGALGDKTGGNSAQRSHRVGRKQPNAFGLYDMSGNVWEWVADPWHPGYTGAGDSGPPADGSVWQGDGAKRVIRGGSWLDYPLLASATYRIYAGAAKRSSDLGFRVARDLP